MTGLLTIAPRGLILTWKPEVPAEVRQAAEPHVERWLTVVPPWCHELILHWDENDTDNNLRTLSALEYRWAKVVICPSYLKLSEVDRSEDMLHEFLHIAVEPLHAVACSLVHMIKKTMPDSEKWADEQRRLGIEATVCDLTRAIAGPRDRPERQRSSILDPLKGGE